MVVSPVPQRPVLIIGSSCALNDMEEQNEFKTVLITGTTGTIGATGRKTVALLLE
jgi:hypothetical protein